MRETAIVFRVIISKVNVISNFFSWLSLNLFCLSQDFLCAVILVPGTMLCSGGVLPDWVSILVTNVLYMHINFILWINCIKETVAENKLGEQLKNDMCGFKSKIQFGNTKFANLPMCGRFCGVSFIFEHITRFPIFVCILKISILAYLRLYDYLVVLNVSHT